jgi:hypothetical protein
MLVKVFAARDSVRSISITPKFRRSAASAVEIFSALGQDNASRFILDTEVTHGRSGR